MYTHDKWTKEGSALIAILLPNLRTGGAERVSLHLAQEFVQRGHRVEFVLMQGQGELIESLPQGVDVVCLNAARLRNFVWPLMTYFRKRSPDVMIANMWPLTIGAIIAKLLTQSRTRLITVDHNMLSLQYLHKGLLHSVALRASIGLLYPFADRRVAVSRGVADDISSLGHVRRETVHVIHNPIFIKTNSTREDVVEHAWNNWKGPRILTVGKLKKQKNHLLLIQAFRRLLSSRDARLMILGSGELREATAGYARAEGVASKVIMPGSIIDPEPYYSSAHLFVLSSDYEGFGNVIVEALSAGLPVVSTDCFSGPREILEDGRHGLLTPVGDADALAAAIDEALSKPWDREQLRRRALDFVPEKVAQTYIDLMFGCSDGAIKLESRNALTHLTFTSRNDDAQSPALSQSKFPSSTRSHDESR